MFRGLTTVNFFADDLAEASAWYTPLFGVEPYYAKEFGGRLAYIEYRLGDYQHEFGFLDRRFAPHPATDSAAGAVVYWAVDDVEAAFQRLLEHGGVEHAKPTEHGPGFVTASVVDPFGNVLGVMYNQHYLDVLAALKSPGE